MRPDEHDPELLDLYRASARETPGAVLDASVLRMAATRRRPRSSPILWAEAAAVALLVSGALLTGRTPSPTAVAMNQDPRFYGLYEGREEAALMALADAGPDAETMDVLLSLGRPEPPRKSQEKTDG